MALFRSTADIKLYTDVHKQTDWSTLKLYVQQAEPTYIIPVISQAMYDKFNGLINDPANASKTFDQIFANENDLTAFNFIACALANYSLYEAFPFLNTAVGDIGVAQQSSKEGTTNPAAQWRYEGRRWAHLLNADRFIDQLLVYMERNADYFTDWQGSSSYTINKDLFIADSFTLSMYIGTNNSRRAYLALRSHIRMAEKKYIIPAIGQELFDELKTEILNKTLTDENKTLLPLIQEGLAWAAYYEGLPFLVIKFNTDGVQVISSNDGINNKLAAGKDEKEIARNTAAHNMDSFLGSLKKFIIDHSSDYPLYEESSAYNNNNPRYSRPYNYYNSGQFRT
jgi:hypothetical protein